MLVETTRRLRVRSRILAGIAIIAVLLTTLAPQPAEAAQPGWADFTFTGSSRDYSGTMTQQAAGFPQASYTSSSVGGSVGVQTGASTFLSTQTDVGARYGSSRGNPYLNLRPNNQNGAPPSVTTYTFERPTPSSGWTFVLGDIDADQVTITATDADGQSVDPAALGFRSVFNYCGPGTCRANDDVPSWDPATGVLRGNADAADTAGAAAWFEPNVPLTSVTFTYAQRAGFPVYQTWFSSLAYDLTGTVSAPEGSQAGITVELYDSEGNLVGDTQTGPDGSYAFPGHATYDDYRVTVVPPDGLTSDDPLSTSVDLSSGDSVVDFALRAEVPVTASGTITNTDGDPVTGVEVTLTDPDGQTTATTTTDNQGQYEFPDVPVGEGWTVTATAPDGTTISDPRTFDVPEGSETPIDDLDFVVTIPVPLGSVSGTVTQEDGSPLTNVTITVTGPDGDTQTTTTTADGTWSLTDLPPGDYTATVTAPDGMNIVGDATRTFTIPTNGGTITEQDFLLGVPAPATHSATGVVTDEADEPLPGIDVVITDPSTGDRTTVTTDADGRWTADDLTNATGYVAEITVPDGYTAVGETQYTFDIDDADITGLDFALAQDVVPTPSADPTPSESSPGTPDESSPGTPDESSPGTPDTSSPGTPDDQQSPPAIDEPQQTPGAPGHGPNSPDGLPATGGPSLPMALGGGALLLAGLFLALRRTPQGASRRG